MTATNAIDYNGRFFWAYDVAKGVLLKFLIDGAEDYCRTHPDDCSWLAAAIARWRIEAITEFGVTIEKSWTESQTATFLKLVGDACIRLTSREAIPAGEVQGWDILDGQGIFARGQTEIQSKHVVELGRAIIALVEGTLPAPPPYTSWFFGAPDGTKTIAIRTRTDAIDEGLNGP